jgi:predicted metal-dependent hydrolase
MEVLRIGEKTVPLVLRRNLRARRYILRVRRDGTVWLTIPRGGAIRFGIEFARRHVAWIEHQLQRRSAENVHNEHWKEGTEILFRGERVRLRMQVHGGTTVVEFADQVVILPAGANQLRAAVENHLWCLAEKEFVPRVLQLGVQHQLTPERVVVRNQRSRWGSCSPRKTISLNWRLIHAPSWVRDYLMVHELMHLREMNHSPRFWRLVNSACPEYRKAEQWLNEHSRLLR